MGARPSSTLRFMKWLHAVGGGATNVKTVSERLRRLEKRGLIRIVDRLVEITGQGQGYLKKHGYRL
jgi:DNA-binding HxlR family transcriptional regulator